MIVVTGMHRSGTSAIAMTMESLGVDFGDAEEFYAPDAWNERGYYERTDVIDVNSKLLTGYARTTGRLAPLLSQVRYVMLPRAAAVAARAKRLEAEVEAVAGEVGNLAVKDPRFCLTLSAWDRWTDTVVVCLRHPAAVAASLHRRQRVPVPLALRFWDHHAEGLLRSVPARSLYVDFDALGGAGRAEELQRMIDGLGLSLSLEEATRRFEDRYSADLRHADSETITLPVRTQRLWSELESRRAAS